MSGRVFDFTHDGKSSAQAAESLARQHSLSFARRELRLTVVLALGFNIAGFGRVYDLVKALANYVHGIESLSAPKTTLDTTIYICSGILLATGFYLLIQRMTMTARGSRSPIQES